MLKNQERFPSLVHRALNMVLGVREHDSQGCYKEAWFIRIGGGEYVLKRGRPRPYESEVLGINARNHDLVRELYAQENRVIRRADIIPYLAWTWVDGILYALQPKGEENRDHKLDDDFEHRMYEHYDGELQDVSGSFNAGVYRGTIRAYDWGYAAMEQFNVTVQPTA